MLHIVEVSFNHDKHKCTDPIEMNIKFNAIEPLSSDVNFKIAYVFDPQQSTYDQVLEEMDIGPIPQGIGEFTIAVDPPKLDKVPVQMLYGVQVLTLTLTYENQEFCHIGYYVNTSYAYEIPFEEDDNGVLTFQFPPNHPVLADMVRHIHADKPRVTRKQIQWGQEGVAMNGAVNV